MFTTFEEARCYVEENSVQMVEFTPRLLEAGVGFDGSAVGLKSVKAGDMVLVPDLSTGFVDPFWDMPTLSFICATLEADTKEVFLNDPRNIALRAYENEMNRSGYSVESGEAAWRSGAGGHGHYIPLHGGYHAIPPKDTLYNLRAEMSLHLQAMGVPIKYHHHEVGGPGQCEIETPLMGLLEAGDTTMIVKYVTKMVAHRRGQTATFMPKPLHGEAGSGMHFHQHLFKGDQNVFYDPAGYGLLSQAALYYIGGLLLHGPALLAFTNPSTNSYRRLVPGFEAPVNAFFSIGNRSAAVRIPRYATQPDQVRFEFRPPDATCNVYLALAAQLLAGLDGVRRQIDPTEAGFGPIDADIFSWTDEQRATIQPLPASLKESMDALAADHDFLLAGGVFSEDLIERWIAFKMDEEYYQVRNRPHPYEMELYFDV
jgi:glutamine synthetase